MPCVQDWQCCDADTEGCHLCPLSESTGDAVATGNRHMLRPAEYVWALLQALPPWCPVFNPQPTLSLQKLEQTYLTIMYYILIVALFIITDTITCISL